MFGIGRPAVRRRHAALTAAAVLFATIGAVATVAPAHAASVSDWDPGPAAYGTTQVTDVQIPMDDGVTLVGDVTYPTDLKTGERSAKKFPVLLTQNPYICQNPTTAQVLSGNPEYYVTHGYIFAMVCVRGTGRSGGTMDYFSPRERKDGVALVDWAAHHLDGSNGKIGLIGCSYLGLTQIFTAGS